MPSSAKLQSKRVVFDSDDSSGSDNDADGHERTGDSLAREMAAAAERERRKNPHAETGRAKLPRAHPLAPSSSSASTAAAAAPKATAAVSTDAYKGKKMDLFNSGSSSDSDDEDDKANSDLVQNQRSPQGATPSTSTPSATSRTANRVAHVQGLSMRAVRGKNNADEAEEPEEGNDTEALHINKAFATRYEEQKRKQELHTLAEKYKGRLGRAAAVGFEDEDADEEEEDEEDDAEEDEDAVLLTRENSLSFAKALLAVRKATVPLAEPAKKGSSTAAAELLPKEELLKERFFPPAEEQVKANTDVFEHHVERKRLGEAGKGRFTLSDEYARALKATADSEDAVVDDGEAGMGERDGLRKLRPQNAEEAKLRAAFLRNVEDSANTFEVVRGSRTNHSESGALSAKAVTETSDDEAQQRAAREEEKRLLEEAFSLGKRSSGAGKRRSTKQAAENSANGDTDEGQASSEWAAEEGADEDGDDAFLRDFFVQELWRPGTSAQKKQKQKKSRKAATSGTADGEAGPEAEDDMGEESGAGEDDDATGGSYYDRLAQLAREEEDEAFFNDAEVWEREYQEKKYRHQEAEEEAANGGASAAHVQTFPRPIGDAATGLLRKPDTSRKDARQRRRERAEAARSQQVEELKRLKHLKRKEIEDQRALIASVAGLTAGRTRNDAHAPFADGDAEEEAELAKLKAVWTDKDLDAPFDPAEFDKKMAQLFDDDYYDTKHVDEDEIAYFDEELDKDDGEAEEEEAAIKAGAAPTLFAANSLEEAQAMLPAIPKKKKGKGGGEVFFDDAFGPQGASSGAGGVGGDALSLLYPSEALQELEKERQQLNDLLAASKSGSGETDADLLERLQTSLKRKEEEYYQLHRTAAAEAAGGGLPFRYREVEPEDFTLSVEEILALDDRQLNMIAPMNCYAAYLDKENNERDRRRIERRRQKGFREVDSDRASRRYGDVRSTALLNPDQIDDDEGVAIAEKLAKRLREEGEDPDAPLDQPQRQHQQQQNRGGGVAHRGRGGPAKWPRTEERGRGRGDAGGFRGRGGGGSGAHHADASAHPPFRGGERGGRGRGRSAPSGSFASSFRGGRGGPRGRGGFRGGH